MREEEKAYNQKSKSKALNESEKQKTQTNQASQTNQTNQNSTNELSDAFYSTFSSALPKTANELQGAKHTGTFARDFGANLKGKPTGNQLDVSSQTFKEQAQNYRNRAAERDIEAQKAQQFGDQNAYAEAGKIASVQNDAQNRQNVNKSKTLGSSASLQRVTNTPDVQQQKQFSAQQRDVANRQRAEADRAREEATGAEGDSMSDAVASRDFDQKTDESYKLSMGNGYGDYSSQSTATQPAEAPADNPAEAEDTSSVKNIGSLQNIINASENSTVRRTDDGNGNIAGWRIGPDGSISQAPEYNRGDPSKAPPYTSDMEKQVQSLAKSGKYGRQENESVDAWTNRVNNDLGRGGNADSAAFYKNQGKQIEQEEVPSDSRIKDLRTVLSDFKMKCIREDFDRDGYCSPEDLKWLISRMKDNNFDMDENSDESVLKGYAENIRNYVYTYKPEAVDIDPSIDPTEEHIGPMAQDIEQVNPACIKETPEGIKTVDTARLSMMNAGAIGDLARQLQDLTDKFNMLLQGE